MMLLLLLKATVAVACARLMLPTSDEALDRGSGVRMYIPYVSLIATYERLANGGPNASEYSLTRLTSARLEMGDSDSDNQRRAPAGTSHKQRYSAYAI